MRAFAVVAIRPMSCKGTAYNDVVDNREGETPVNSLLDDALEGHPFRSD